MKSGPATFESVTVSQQVHTRMATKTVPINTMLSYAQRPHTKIHIFFSNPICVY